MSSDTQRPARGATRDDVARLAGVSSAVVSYVVNNGPRPVAEATRLKVLDAIDKLGYRPNAAARSLIMGRSDLVGLIVPDVRNPYFAALAQAVEVEARKEGVNLVLAQGPTGHLAALVESLSGHLVEVHGHRRIALVSGSDTPTDHRVLDDRERAWRDVLMSAGLPTDAVIRVNWSLTAGREAAARLVRDFPDCTAVFAMSDQQAIGLISGLTAAGRSIPGDVAITSFDGSPEAEFTIPPLTTASVPMAAMAKAAVKQLLHPGGRGKVFAPELILRHSCGC